MNTFFPFLLLLLALNVRGQSVQNRNWVYSNVVYNASTNKKVSITNSLPKGGGIVHHKAKEYNYFIFWTKIRNESPFPVELKIQFSPSISFGSKDSYAKVVFTKSTMTSSNVPAFDYGLTNIPALLANESNQLKDLTNRILPQNEYLFYIPIFIHKTKWPVRAAFVLSDKKLFYKITAGTDTVMVPCGGIKFLSGL